MDPKPNDPAIEEIRVIRRRISERFAHDPRRLVAHYLKLQQRYGDRVVKESLPKTADQSAAS